MYSFVLYLIPPPGITRGDQPLRVVSLRMILNVIIPVWLALAPILRLNFYLTFRPD